ncbi:transcriptional repressor LexA [Geomonas sp. Red32]|uniref:transcriptional repressor LexA n=1 Tax=Geomonas sp. Red32 TaxID=2912856 RepID=UPI00202CE6A7|nr:transcriptional repressor LexA [Geomonas sp. Red32]MCM0080195.1 transcriptional repressor LexA [Geomonas sp. Red32]
MTPKQRKVLEFILEFQQRQGYQPSQQEIAKGCGFESLGTVQHYLRILERDGFLSRQWNAKRGLRLTVAEGQEGNPPWPPFAKGGEYEAAFNKGGTSGHRGTLGPEIEILRAAAHTELPLIGIVAAGRPVEAYQMADAIEVPSAMAGPGNVVYEVRGDSMVEMGIMNGDYVAVHPQAVAENGQTVIAEVNGSITIKTYFRKGDVIELRPANVAMQPIIVTEVDDFRIRGVLVGSMRFYRKWTGKSSI